MKINFKLGYEAINTKNYRRFGSQYINYYLTDGSLRKAKCAMKFVPEDPFVEFVGNESFGKSWTEAIGIIEIGEANYDIYSIIDINNFGFTHNEEILARQILSQSDDRIIFAVDLGAVEPYEELILYPRISEEIEEFDVNIYNKGFIYFNQFTGPSAFNEFEYSFEGNVSIYWSPNHGGSIRITASGPSIFKLYRKLDLEKNIIADASLKFYILQNKNIDLRFGFWQAGSWLKYLKIKNKSGFNSISINNLITNSFYILLSGEIPAGSAIEIDLVEISIIKRYSSFIFFLPKNIIEQ